MSKAYYEVVFEGYYRAINGLLEGFRLGAGKEWDYFFSNEMGIKTETLTEIILEWFTLKTKLHHVILEEDFYNKFSKAVAGRKESKFVNTRYIRSARRVSDASFTFEAKTYGQKYGEEIKAQMKHLPDGLELHDYNPIEKHREDAKGAELYAPEHEYMFEAEGRISGPIDAVADFRKELDDHPLVAVKEIILKLD